MPPGAVAPDAFDDVNGPVPSDTFVVSRDRVGQPKSLFRDLMWDLSAYNPEGKVESLHFNFWGKGQPTVAQHKLSVEMRCVVVCLIWQRVGAPLSSGTLRNYLSVLSALADYANGLGISLGTVFEEEPRLLDFVHSRCSGWMAETLSSLLPQLCRIGPKALGFDVVSDRCINNLKRQNKQYRAGIKQHPPMPTRIYSHFISGLQQQLSDWNFVSKDVLNAARYCAKDPRAGRSLEWQRQIAKVHNLSHERFPPLEELLTEPSIAYFKAQGKPVEVNSLSTLIGQAQYVAKLTIQTFSGMRDDEVNTLPHCCLSTSVSRGTKHHLILGRTTKFAHGLAKRTQWVTNREGHYAIQAAKEIADAIYDVYGVTPASEPERVNNHPLFVSVGYLKFVGVKIEPKNGQFVPGAMSHRELPEGCVAVIEENDLRELEQIDPHRAWRAEDKFKLGAPWTFTSHQTRRSLALYAQRSGLVSLPSLRRQLKHITEEMARYYAKGSAFAKNFIGGDKKHFGFEWQAAHSESSALSYILNVLMSGEVLFGGHAAWIQQRLKKPDGIILKDRQVTMKRFKKGEMAYRETIMGGCTNIGTCDKVAVQWLHTACVIDNCKNLVIEMAKLDLVIAAQQKMIGRIDKDSVEYRTEYQDLQSLIEMRERNKSRSEISREQLFN